MKKLICLALCALTLTLLIACEDGNTEGDSSASTTVTDIESTTNDSKETSEPDEISEAEDTSTSDTEGTTEDAGVGETTNEWLTANIGTAGGVELPVIPIP